MLFTGEHQFCTFDSVVFGWTLVRAHSRRRLYLRSPPYRERRLQREEKYDKNLKEKG
jgi:hypothetical protein